MELREIKPDHPPLGVRGTPSPLQKPPIASAVGIAPYNPYGEAINPPSVIARGNSNKRKGQVGNNRKKHSSTALSTALRILLPYQQRWVNDKSLLKIWLASRQVGKSFSIAMEAVTEALESKCNNLILSSSERQSKEVISKVYFHLRYLKVKSDEIIRAEKETKEEVQLPNGSRIISLPANPDTVRGFSGNVFLDEFAFHKDTREIWRAMYPTVTRGYKVRVTSTPNGKQNMFYELWNLNPARPPFKGQRGFAPLKPQKETTPQGGDKAPYNPSLCHCEDAELSADEAILIWSKHKTDIYDAVKEGLKVDISSLHSGINDPDAWASEFECQFIDEATAFITYEMINACEDEMATKDYRTSALSHYGTVALPSCHTAELYLGVDIGRKHDLTVFWLWEKIGDVFWTRMVKEMYKATFKEQRDFLCGIMDGSVLEGYTRGTQVPLVRRACIDSTGLGMQLSEEAIERFGSRVEAVTFTSRVKEDLAWTMRRKFEDRLLRIPIDRNIREDLHFIKKFITSSGNVRFDAETTEQGHSDRFWAAALGIHAAQTTSLSIAYEPILKRRFIEGSDERRFQI